MQLSLDLVTVLVRLSRQDMSVMLDRFYCWTIGLHDRSLIKENAIYDFCLHKLIVCPSLHTAKSDDSNIWSTILLNN